MLHRIMILLGVIGLVVSFQNCGMTPSHTGGSSDNSLASKGCGNFLKEAYRQTYYPVFRNSAHCVGCHAESGQAGDSRWFAASNFDMAYERFSSIGRSKIESFAVSQHKPPYTGADLQPIVNTAQSLWTEAENAESACSGSLEVVTTAKSIPTTITTVTDPNAAPGTAAWTTLSWNLDQDMKKTTMNGKIKANFSFQIRRVDQAGDLNDYYQVRNPTVQITAPAEGNPAVVPTFTFQRVMTVVNSALNTNFTAWRELNAATNSTTGQNLTPGAGYFNLYIKPSDQVALAFEAILKGGQPIVDPGGGGGVTLPNITYADLMNGSGPYGVFASRCISCHGGNRSDGGFRIDNYTSAFNNRMTIINRVQSSGNPMPPGAFMSQGNRDIVQKWIDIGAPQ